MTITRKLIFPLFRLASLLLLSTFCLSVVKAQELKKRRKNRDTYLEEYYVLKEDKSIKHGQYVKYEKSSLIPVELGHFANNLKEGTWYICDSKGILRNIGRYSGGQRSGKWLEFFKPTNNSFLNGIAEHAGLKADIKIDDEGNATVDVDGLRLSSEGNYLNGKKTGLWKYYTRKGDLIQKYDHSKNSMVLNREKESSTSKCPFVGGYERLSDLFWLLYHKDTHIPWIESQVKVSISSKNGTVRFKGSDSVGDYKFQKAIIATFEKLPNDWLLPVIKDTNSASVISFSYKQDVGFIMNFN